LPRNHTARVPRSLATKAKLIDGGDHFIFSPQVHWLQASVACVGAALGGVVGGHMVSRVNQQLLRVAAVLIGIALTIALFIRAP